MSRNEPNTILEINEANTDNFFIVIPRLPTAQYLGSAFQNFTKPSPIIPVSGSGPSNDCDSLHPQQVRREHNLDMTNFRLYLSEVAMPAVNIDKVDIGTQFATLARASKINFGDLNTTMMVSENFLNYNILLYWLYALHNPEEYNKMSGREMINNFFTDVYLVITNNHREKVAEYKFMDAFPITLGSLPFSYLNAENISTEVVWAHSGMYPSDNFVLRYI
jgi:hypothetical protein